MVEFRYTFLNLRLLVPEGPLLSNEATSEGCSGVYYLLKLPAFGFDKSIKFVDISGKMLIASKAEITLFKIANSYGLRYFLKGSTILDKSNGAICNSLLGGGGAVLIVLIP